VGPERPLKYKEGRKTKEKKRKGKRCQVLLE
jgi:hypothetical protein